MLDYQRLPGSILLAVIVSGPYLLAQSAPLAFEVASIHPVEEQRTWVRIAGRDGEFVAQGATLKVLVQFAYGAQAFQVSSGDLEWAESRDYTFDVRGKPAGKATENEIRRMVQTLLEERFQLKVRHNVKQIPGYALKVSPKGHKLKQAQSSAAAGFYSVTPLASRRLPIAELIDYLSGVILSVPVVDETGLDGNYEFSVRWTPDETQFRGAGGKGFYAGDPNGPTIVEAFEDQLGLKLERRTMPADFIVVESAEQPSDN